MSETIEQSAKRAWIEVATLREQVEFWQKEAAGRRDDMANYTRIVSETIDRLNVEVSKLTKERDDLTKTLELMEHTRDTEQIRHREMMSEKREQLAALAEQNEKYRKVIPHCVVGASGYAVEQLFIECLSLPGLASPVLNRIRAEGVRKASTLVSLVRNDWASAGDNLSVQAAEYLISALDARAAELEKTNG